MLSRYPPRMHYEPVAGSGVWYGRELAQSASWIRNLGAREIEEVDAAVHAFQKSGASAEAICRENFPLPRLGPVLREVLAELLEGRGFILLRGLPVERMTRE